MSELMVLLRIIASILSGVASFLVVISFVGMDLLKSKGLNFAIGTIAMLVSAIYFRLAGDATGDSMIVLAFIWLFVAIVKFFQAAFISD